MVKTKSLYHEAQESDGERILVTRYWPRGISKTWLRHKEWMRDVAPSKELLEDWKKQRISWEEYTVRYHREMRGQREIIRALAKKAKHCTTTLLCFEHEDNPHCHRHLLKKLIEREQQRKQ